MTLVWIGLVVYAKLAFVWIALKLVLTAHYARPRGSWPTALLGSQTHAIIGVSLVPCFTLYSFV